MRGLQLMKNDIKQIKNELQEEKSKVKTQNQIKKRQERLKSNLYEVISEMLETGKTYLYVLEEKHKIIFEAIKRTNEEETKEQDTNEWAEFDILPGTYKKRKNQATIIFCIKSFLLFIAE